MPQCLIPNCPNEAVFYLGVRLRRPASTQYPSAGTAIWAPDCDAYLCEQHAAQGYTINIQLTPGVTGSITTNTTAGGIVVTRTTPIAHTP